MQAQDSAAHGNDIRPSAVVSETHVRDAGFAHTGGPPTRGNAGLAIPRQHSEPSARLSAERPPPQASIDDSKRSWTCGSTKPIGTHLRDSLSAEKARLERDGPNLLNLPKRTPWYLKPGRQFSDFVAILLQIASVLPFVGYALDRSSSTNLLLGIVLYAVVPQS
jgi:Cation transporter/ATPase, N-terminus